MTFGKRMIRLRRNLGHVFAFGAIAILLFAAESAAQTRPSNLEAAVTPSCAPRSSTP
jgi:hypothetical protein